MMKERNVKFDILRGIGIVLMIMGHIDFGLEFSHYIHAFHMPIFFFVTGFFFNRGRGIWDSIKHDLRTLILPYSVFWALCQVLHYLYTHEFSLQYSVLSYFTSNHNRIDVSGVYWFLLCLFTARQLFWIINTVRNENGKLVLVLILTLVGNNLRQFAKLPLCLDSAMSAVLLMYLGFQYRKFQNHAWVKHLMNLSVWQILLGLAGNAWLIMLNGTVNLRTNYYANIPLYWLNSIEIVGVSDIVSDFLRQCYPDTANKVVTLENYVDAEKLRQKATAYQVGRRNEFTLCTCGRLATDKCFDRAVEAAFILKNHGYSFHWYFVGDGPQREEIEELISQKGLCQEIELTGSKDNPFPYFHSSDVFVLCTDDEALPMTLIESKILCLPIISTKTAGGYALVADGENGLLVDMTAEAVAEAAIYCICDGFKAICQG